MISIYLLPSQPIWRKNKQQTTEIYEVWVNYRKHIQLSIYFDRPSQLHHHQAPMAPYPGIFSIFVKSHSLLHNGHTDRVLSHRWIQSRWNTCPHVPNAILRPFSLFGDGLAYVKQIMPWTYGYEDHKHKQIRLTSFIDEVYSYHFKFHCIERVILSLVQWTRKYKFTGIKLNNKKE